MGYEVDKLCKISIKISNAEKYIELDIWDIEAPRKWVILSSLIDEKTYL